MDIFCYINYYDIIMMIFYNLFVFICIFLFWEVCDFFVCLIFYLGVVVLLGIKFLLLLVIFVGEFEEIFLFFLLWFIIVYFDINK